MASILIIDRQNTVCREFGEAIRSLGHSLKCVPSAANALECDQPVDVVFLDVTGASDDMTGSLQALRALPSRPEVVVMNLSTSPEEAERAIRGGAWDYVECPSSWKVLSVIISRVVQFRLQRLPSTSIRREAKFDGIVGNSAQMIISLELIAQAAESDANVLITGETGTGKELVASAIHSNSPRAGKNFVVVDCAAIPENLVESTLLGHERGAFTGAERTHVGLIRQADGGTLFLDEVGELPPAVQKSFLRVLQERKFRPVGAKTEVHSDFRIIAASNRNLSNMVESGEFRKDLLFRIRAFSIELTPLRERPEDIPELIRFHVPLICGRMDIPVKTISDELFSVVSRYAWPGNARELVNSLERSIAAARYEPTIFPTHLPTYIRVSLAKEATSQPTSLAPTTESITQNSLPPLSEVRGAAIHEAEEQYLRTLVERHGDINEACLVSGLSRSRLYALLKKYDISSSR